MPTQSAAKLLQVSFELSLKWAHTPEVLTISYKGIPMKRLLLIALLVLSSAPAYAEWVQIDKTNDGMTIYIDPDTIRRKGNLVKMWKLFDHMTMQTKSGVSFFSIKGQDEFDCSGERSRVLAATFFRDNRGRGMVVGSISDEGKWQPVEPESVGQVLWEFACGKK